MRAERRATLHAVSGDGSELVRQVQLRLEGRELEPAPDEIDKARAAVLTAARAFFVAVEARSALFASGEDYWTVQQPGAAERSTYRRLRTVARVILEELGAPAPLEPAELELEPPPPSAMPVPVRTAPIFTAGELVRDVRTELVHRVIREGQHPAMPGLAVLVERAGGPHAGEQEWMSPHTLRRQ